MFEELNILHKAVRSNECTPKIIRDIVREQPALLNSVDCYGIPPLYIALRKVLPVKIIEEMLQLGADVNFRNTCDESLLHYAIYRYRKSDALFDIVKLFIKFGADVNTKAKSNRTPLYTLLHYVTGNMCKKVLYLLLTNGVKTNQISGNFEFYVEDTSFKVRQLGFNLELSKMLLEFGVEPDLHQNKFLLNAIYKKEMNHHSIEFVKLLMQYMLMNEIKSDVLKDKSIIANKQYDKIVSLDSFLGQKCHAELIDYRNSLMRELTMMLQDEIGEGMTLFSFISKRCSSGLDYEKSEESVLRNVIFIFQSHRYVCCNDLFLASFKQEALISVLCNNGIFAKKSIPKSKSCIKVIMTCDTILQLASYLSRRDILNLILAYWIPVCRNKSFPVKRCSRKRVNSLNNILNDSSNILTKHLKLKK